VPQIIPQKSRAADLKSEQRLMIFMEELTTTILIERVVSATGSNNG